MTYQELMDKRDKVEFLEELVKKVDLLSGDFAVLHLPLYTVILDNLSRETRQILESEKAELDAAEDVYKSQTEDE